MFGNRFAADRESRNQLMKHVADTKQACPCRTKDVCSASGTWLLWSALMNRREAKLDLRKAVGKSEDMFCRTRKILHYKIVLFFGVK
jgi:hypothetical protein